LSLGGGEEEIDDGVPSAGEEDDQDHGKDGESHAEQCVFVFFFYDAEKGVDKEDADACQCHDRVDEEDSEDEERIEDDASDGLVLEEPEEEDEEE